MEKKDENIEKGPKNLIIVTQWKSDSLTWSDNMAELLYLIKSQVWNDIKTNRLLRLSCYLISIFNYISVIK